MVDETQLGTPLDGPISADAIESALAACWRQLRSTSSSEHPIVRTSVLTLIVCVTAPGRLDQVLAAIRNLSRAHPSRTIILLPDQQGDGHGVRVWYQASCILRGEREVCGEQIVIAAHGDALAPLSSLTDQLMLSDLPSFLWWVGDLRPEQDILFTRLTRLADRLIVDSSDFTALGPSLAVIARIASRRQQPCAPSDLNWTRLTPCRELIAQFFDPMPMRPWLTRLDQIVVTYAADRPAGLVQALLLGGWLASRLHWRLDRGLSISREGSGTALLRRADGQPIVIDFQARADAGAHGIIQVRLRAGEAAAFVLTREGSQVHARTEADHGSRPALRRTASCAPEDLASLLSEELALFQRDQVYEAALQAALELGGFQP
ncbi:MAG: glucose-6-phosphate dehydrogenase assembly protein OpcA [Chloroflexi bacterium]|nr:glucose-6-phosphate dehydrogenase assembly protein OpcA [Chloroflexota bacterium]